MTELKTLEEQINKHNQTQSIEQVDFGLTRFFAGIYKWMAVGVAVSGVTAFLVAKLGYLPIFFSNIIFFYGLIGVELILVFGIQMAIRKLSPQTSLMLFLLYSFINGLTMSVIFAVYGLGDITSAFTGAVVLYIILAVMGYRTKKDLSSWSTLLFPMVWAIVISSLLNMFVFQSSVFNMIISIGTLLVFGALTIYDNQTYKAIYHSLQGQHDEKERYVVLGALHMYINFVAIFQSILSLMGGSRD